MTWIDTNLSERVSQGDVYKDIELIESANEIDGNIVVSKIMFPLIVVLTQDCDLKFDYDRRYETKDKNENKLLLSVIVAPIYNFEHFVLGEHLSEIKFRMEVFRKEATPYKNIKNNQNPRYHYLEFEKGTNIIKTGVIDFKHYFTVNILYLESIRKTNFVCKIQPLFREDISQRFASFLSRIGLPTSS